MASNLTKQAITASFMKLLNRKPLDKITVRDIVEDCGLNRNTFYYHYRDIYALLQEIFETETKECISRHRPDSSWQAGFTEVVGFALKNKRAVFHVFNSAKRELFEKYLFDVSESFMADIVHKEAEGLEVNAEDLKYITVFYKHAVGGILIEWLLLGMQEPPEYVISRMGEIFEGSIRYTLEKIAKNEK